MGTIAGILVLALIAYLIRKNTGLSFPQWISKKYQAHLEAKNKHKKENDSR